jgi:mRNA interferase MazF
MTIQRGEVYFIDLGSPVGREQAGRSPVVVISNDTVNKLPLVVTVVPGTRKVKAPTPYPWNVMVLAGEGNLPEDTTFLTFQVRALDPSRFRNPPLGKLSVVVLDQLEKTIAWTLAIPIASVGAP